MNNQWREVNIIQGFAGAQHENSLFSSEDGKKVRVLWSIIIEPSVAIQPRTIPNHSSTADLLCTRSGTTLNPRRIVQPKEYTRKIYVQDFGVQLDENKTNLTICDAFLHCLYLKKTQFPNSYYKFSTVARIGAKQTLMAAGHQTTETNVKRLNKLLELTRKRLDFIKTSYKVDQSKIDEFFRQLDEQPLISHEEQAVTISGDSIQGDLSPGPDAEISGSSLANFIKKRVKQKKTVKLKVRVGKDGRNLMPSERIARLALRFHDSPVKAVLYGTAKKIKISYTGPKKVRKGGRATWNEFNLQNI